MELSGYSASRYWGRQLEALLRGKMYLEALSRPFARLRYSLEEDSYSGIGIRLWWVY